MAVDLSAGEIHWLGLVPRSIAHRIQSRITLQGTPHLDGPQITEIIPDVSAPVYSLSRHVPVAQNLVPLISYRPFGVEERVSYRLGPEGLVVDCQAGHKPAGLLFELLRNKLSPGLNLQMQMAYQTDGSFSLGMADEARFSRGDPVLIPLPRQARQWRGGIPYKQLEAGQAVHWSLSCPQQAAMINVDAFSLQPQARNQPALTTNPDRDIWIWRPNAWQDKGKKLLAMLQRYGVNRVFVSVDTEETQGRIRHARQLEEFINQAGKKGIAVWVVEGDPHATQPAGQRRFVRRAQILQQYNTRVSANSRVSGVQYDIEPYLVNGWNLEPDAWLDAYVETLQKIRQTLDLELEIVIPFWWQFKAVGGQSWLDRIRPHIDSLNVMDYRTNPRLIKQFAQPFLDWGVRAQVPVSIALEAGTLPDETQWHFHKQKPGDLWLINALSTPILVWVKHAKHTELAKTFQQERTSRFDALAVSFQQDPQRLIELLPELEALWRHWPSFRSISLHGFEEQNL